MTREFDRNNPLGVSFSKEFPWENVDYTYPGRANRNDPNDVPVPGIDNLLGDHLVAFRTMQDGANAAAWLLAANYFKQGISDTPETLGDKWAGDSENKANAAGRTSYGDSIAEIMKDQPLQILTYQADGVLVMATLCREENGTPEAETLSPEIWPLALSYGAMKSGLV